MVMVVKADCQSFAAVDIVVIAAVVVAVYYSPLPSWGGVRTTAITAAARGVEYRGIHGH
jgi:hypothetical protein